MGPMLLHTNNVRLTDKKLKSVAAQRYQGSIEIAHKTLHAFYSKQPDQYQDKRGKFKW